MRRLMVIMGILVVLLVAGALPAFAGDGDLLGSGAVAPAGAAEAAAPVEVAGASSAVSGAGEDALAYTGLDSGAALLLGVGLTAAGGAAIFASRKRAKS